MKGRLSLLQLMLLHLLFTANDDIQLISAQPTILNSLPGYTGVLPFSLETGYVGVGESEEVQLFYYFVESERDVERDPLMLWLTGGPGCSAFSGLVFEIGPLIFDYTAKSNQSSTPKLLYNPQSWSKVASIIFVDSPVGTGFSYATNAGAYNSDDNLQSAHLYDFLTKWLLDHPKFKGNPLYVGGDSYSGVVVPIVVQDILIGNERGFTPNLNLKGYVLGNPSGRVVTDQNAKIKYAHRVSLASDEQFKVAKISCKGEYTLVDPSNKKCQQALQAIEQDTQGLDKAQVLEYTCPFNSPNPHESQSHNSRLNAEERTCRALNYQLSYAWANNERVREALRIREGSVHHWVRCNLSLPYKSYIRDGFYYHRNLTHKSLRALIYSGDQDMVVPYIGTHEWIKDLNLPTLKDWRAWFVDGQVAGYATEYGGSPYRLIFTTIKGAGHTAPEYKPRECLTMLDRWLSSRPL